MGPLWPRSTCRLVSVLPTTLLPLPSSTPPPGLPLPLPLAPPQLPLPQSLLLVPPLPLLRCCTSHRMAVWSLPHDASMRPSCENCRCQTSSEWSSSTCSHGKWGGVSVQGWKKGWGVLGLSPPNNPPSSPAPYLRGTCGYLLRATSVVHEQGGAERRGVVEAAGRDLRPQCLLYQRF